jgi:excinuclease UvrABC nuclease subunit
MSIKLIIVGKQRARRLTMQITWSSFRSSYTEAEVKKHVVCEAGVYLLWVKLKSGKWRCFYVGQASDLQDRLLDHLSGEEENDCIKKNVSKYICGFEYAQVSKESDRNGIEKFLYDHYKPECNNVDPGGSPIEVNIP